MKIRFAVLLSLFVFLTFCGCSNVLNVVLTPFAPTFVPSVTLTSNGPRIDCAISRDYDEDEDGGYTQNFAYYIFRSTTSPYADYKLIARNVIDGAATSYDWGKYDFTLPHDGVPTHKASSCTYVIDSTAPSGVVYYRMSKITLTKSVTKSDDGEVSSISYYLSDDTSGWVSVEVE